MIRALCWDVDGTLSETEETHRAAFNDAFAMAGLDWVWDQPAYRRLLQVTGGKERMARSAAERGMQLDAQMIAAIHQAKTETYGAMVETGSASREPVSATTLRLHGRAASSGLSPPPPAGPMQMR